jgi:hypothetical protein
LRTKAINPGAQAPVFGGYGGAERARRSTQADDESPTQRRGDRRDGDRKTGKGWRGKGKVRYREGGYKQNH